MFLHQRDAHDDFFAILKEHGVRNGVAHCFTAGERERDAYLELGLCIGITGWINDERRGRHLREVVKGIPAQRLLIETDAPYLLPRDIKPAPKSRRNEPHYLPYVARAIAAARGETLEAVAACERPRRRADFLDSAPLRREGRRQAAQATAIGIERKCGLGLQVSLMRSQPGRYLETAISSSAAPSLGNSAATDSSITVKRGRPFGNLARLVNTMRPSIGVSGAMAFTLAMRS